MLLNKLDFNRLVRANILKLTPYSSARGEFKGSASVFLDANENPLGSGVSENWNRYPDPLQLAIYHEPMVLLGEQIHQARITFLADFLPRFQMHYSALSDDREQVNIFLESTFISGEFDTHFIEKYFTPEQINETYAQDALLASKIALNLFLQDKEKVKFMGT